MRAGGFQWHDVHGPGRPNALLDGSYFSFASHIRPLTWSLWGWGGGRGTPSFGDSALWGKGTPLHIVEGGGGWHKASVSDCLPLATPIGLSPLHIPTLCGPERVLVVSTEPPDDLSCLTTPGVGRPGDGAVARAVDQVHPDAQHSESMRGFGRRGGGLFEGADCNSYRSITSLLVNVAAVREGSGSGAAANTAAMCGGGPGLCKLAKPAYQDTRAPRLRAVQCYDRPTK